MFDRMKFHEAKFIILLKPIKVRYSLRKLEFISVLNCLNRTVYVTKMNNQNFSFNSILMRTKVGVTESPVTLFDLNLTSVLATCNLLGLFIVNARLIFCLANNLRFKRFRPYFQA